MTPVNRAQRWIGKALMPEIRNRAFVISLVVGTILVLINYADRIYLQTLVQADFYKMALTYFVPYCVSTYSAVEALLKKDL